MIVSVFFVLLIAISCYSTAVAQIPKECSDDNSLRRKECCPTPSADMYGNNAGECGNNLPTPRGTCQDIVKCHKYNSDPNTDPRFNWPSYFFIRACSCIGNFAGFDCGECKFGYTGDNCDEKTNSKRKSINDASVDWNKYIDTLKKAKMTESRYVILHFDETVINQPVTVSTKLTIQYVNLYDFFAWMHHYVAKNNNEKGYGPDESANDYAHESAGFLTWHRLFLLWFEREVQMSIDKKFVLHYWDWTVPTYRNSLFDDHHLGGNDGSGTVTGMFGESEWQTVCWFKGEENEFKHKTCNVTNTDGIHTLIRCPLKKSCETSDYWPAGDSVNEMLSLPMYRNPSEAYPYNKFATQTFSNSLEGFVPELNSEKCSQLGQYPNTGCEPDDTDAVTRTLHNLVHITLGIGFLQNGKNIGMNAGTMADVAASANDPVFLNHHTMIDCLFEQWLQKHPEVTEYVGPDNEIFAGHNKEDCIVPFIPLYTHRDMFKRASEFGYSCDLRAFPRNCPNSNKKNCPNAPPGNNTDDESGASLVEGRGLLLILFLVISLATTLYILV